MSGGGRLGIYLDGDFRLVSANGDEQLAVHPADYALVGRFLLEVGSAFDELVLFGRADRRDDLGEYVPLPDAVGFVALPYYETLTQLGAVAGAATGTTRAAWRGLELVDTIWVFGPHPFSLLLAGLARTRGKDVVLGVRQDTLAYFRARLPNRRWAPAMVPIHALDASYRGLSRAWKTVVIGPAIARRYGGARSNLLALISDSIVPAAEMARGPQPHDWDGELRLLTVGRIDPEKNPLLLVDALAALNRSGPRRFRLVWVGDGPLATEVRTRAHDLGVSDDIDLRGWMPFGPELVSLYRDAHLFVHVSLTEGMPRVITEALAFALPIVATDVGGVREAVDDGGAALLVPPSDRDALVAAVTTLAADAELRERLVARGLELARERTLEGQAKLVADFIQGSDGLPSAANRPE